ncbi:5-methylcytosine-specific restriction enzyme subunit McrC [Psychrobacter pacificensis]|uniref:5-methylcytosine-specific restriction enzyme subunit McrC n=1 Tax=Psychrobacter pacificensis TaxID=112002 RepID=A0A1G6U6C9_9GAMM|nr:McrC family protein [Psychrobacter pacificensis]SDD36831.1 5-methylcytosine-specific restriction enzyme subunit McrC [Psychrobacter pacificensis]
MRTHNQYYAQRNYINADSFYARIPNSQALVANVITVFEHQRLTAHDFAHVSDFHWLMAQEFAVFTIKRKQGQWQLKVGHHIGIILLPSGMTLELLPKLNQSTGYNNIAQTRHWVQGMLSDLTRLDARQSRKLPSMKNLGQFSDQSMPLSVEAQPLSDWLLEQFLQRLAHYQPTQHYQAQINNQSSLQGRLLIKEQLRYNSMQPHKFVCERSVLSQDMLANRLIKSALILLMPLLPRSICTPLLRPWQPLFGLNQRERQRLASIYTQAKQQLSVLPLQKQQLQAAQQLVDLAYWLLQQSNASTGYGIDPTRPNLPQPRLCLLIDMNQAFEQWASQRIASMFQQVSSHYRAFYQTQSVWLNDSEGQACVSIRPDLLIYKTADNDNNQNQSDTAVSKETVNDCYSHVIDIKWKYLPHAGAITASDAYQLTSYAQAYQAGQGWMVYPVLGDKRRPVALKQQIYRDNGDNKSNISSDISDGTNSNHSNHADLWLIPFDVLTGMVNGDLPANLNEK